MSNICISFLHYSDNSVGEVLLITGETREEIWGNIEELNNYQAVLRDEENYDGIFLLGNMLSNCSINIKKRMEKTRII